MFEVFERREKQRKIRELREVCPDISEEEAVAALDMCNGREDEAAACLVSDANFKRRVRAACGIAAPLAREGNGGTRGGRNWPARPTGPRPKLIDPATLGDSVFVGTFRGKGFQGASRGAKVQRPSARQQARAAADAAAADGGEWDEEDGEEGIEGEGGEEQEEIAAAGEKVEEIDEEMGAQDTPDQDANEEIMEGEPSEVAGPSAAAAGPTPPTVPKKYALVKETSEGDVRLVTDSELKRASTALHRGESASPTAGAVVAGASPDTATATKGGAGGRTRAAKQQEEEKNSPLPTRASTRRPNAGGAVLSLTMLEKMVLKVGNMDDAEAAVWLAKMAPETTSNVLQTLGSDFPERAVMLQDLVEAEKNKPAAEKETIVADTKATKAEGTAAEKSVDPMAVDGNPQQSRDKDGASGWDSEATMSEGDAPPQRSGRATRERRTSSRPQRTSGRKKSYVDDDDVEESIDIEADTGRSGGRKAGNKRRKSVTNEEPAVGAVAAADSGPSAFETIAMEIEQPTSATDDEPAVPAAATATRRAARSNSNTTGVAISAKGHTNRGRVKQKSHKSADLVEAGNLHVANGWHNAGYIFPEGFHSRTLFRSSVALDQLCVHECYIIGKGGKYWPLPTFKVVSLDRPEEPLIAKSCTGCWTGVLKRINAEIEARRKAGEDLPPPPKTAIAGPEYFGLNQPNIQEAIEDLDAEHKCEQYWSGKQERQMAAAGLPVPVRENAAPRVPRAPRAVGPSRRRRGSAASDEEHGNVSDEDETQYMTNRWSAVGRTDRYRKRLEDNGDDTTALDADPDNPVPEIIDPVTLEPVVRPAISPYGHVMGAATWRAVLAENGICPFTKQPLRWEQCRVLTLHNIEAYRDKIIR